MAFVVVTRLRLRDAQYRDEFFGAALAVMEQATHSEGNVAADVLADADDTFWTRTAWNDRAAMSRFLNSEPHFDTMSRIDEWCDEATFAGGPGPHGRPSHSIIPVTRPYLPRHWLAG